MATTEERVRMYNPFDYLPIFPARTREMHSAWFLLPGIVVGLVLVTATWAEGTLGSVSDTRFTQDARNAFAHDIAWSEPNFPLVRDWPSCLLFVVVVAGMILLHRQWQYIAASLPKLRELNAVRARRQPRLNLVSRLMRLDSVIGGCADYRAVHELDERFADVKPRTKATLLGAVLLGGFVLATLAGSGLSRNLALFLAPTTVGEPERERWLAQARESWWAGSNHPLGLVLFALLTWFAMSLVLATNVIGVYTVYVAIAYSFVMEPSADWYDRDGRFGWMPVVRIFRTVYWSLGLLGIGISFVIVVLGVEVAVSVAGLIIMYAVLLPVYTVVPWLVFRRMDDRVRNHRIDELSRASVGIDASDPAQAQAFVGEFARVRSARIRPMRLRTVQFGAFTSVVLLPLALTMLQIVASAGVLW